MSASYATSSLCWSHACEKRWMDRATRDLAAQYLTSQRTLTGRTAIIVIPKETRTVFGHAFSWVLMVKPASLGKTTWSLWESTWNSPTGRFHCRC